MFWEVKKKYKNHKETIYLADEKKQIRWQALVDNTMEFHILLRGVLFSLTLAQAGDIVNILIDFRKMAGLVNCKVHTGTRAVIEHTFQNQHLLRHHPISYFIAFVPHLRQFILMKVLQGSLTTGSILFKHVLWAVLI